MTTEHELLERITVRPDVFGGKPIIRDMRIAVETRFGDARCRRHSRGHPAGIPIPGTRRRSGVPVVRAQVGVG